MMWMMMMMMMTTTMMMMTTTMTMTIPSKMDNWMSKLIVSSCIFTGDPQAELVRHFLIEPTPKGVRLRGCSNEPVFGQ
jgi:hypothetical protein